MPVREEQFYEQAGEVEQFFHIWLPEQPPHAVVALVHGLGDHSGCFARLAEDFAEAGIAVCACDLYGNGRSGGVRGDAPSYALLLDEAEALVERARRRFPGLPVVLYGHSMGGNLVLNLALRRRPQVACVVASAPWLAMVRCPRLRALAAGAVALAAPRHRFDSGLNPDGLSHDPAFAQRYTTDPLVHGFVSARLFVQVSRAGRWALRHARQLALPTLLVHGGADPITSCAASRLFAKRSDGAAAFREMPGDYHTLHNERDAQELFSLVRGWVQAYLPVGRRAASGRAR